MITEPMLQCPRAAIAEACTLWSPCSAARGATATGGHNQRKPEHGNKDSVQARIKKKKLLITANTGKHWEDAYMNNLFALQQFIER